LIRKYPLSWPIGWKRADTRIRGRFVTAGNSVGNSRLESKRVSVETAMNRIFDQLRRMGVPNGEALISSNLELNSWGIPRAERSAPRDPGVAVYWELRGKPQCMAIDLYDRVADNLAAVAASLEALRAIERHGGAAIMERAFMGFAQLPGDRAKHWREVLGFGGATATVAAIEDRYRELAKSAHPDHGGNPEKFREIVAARDAALHELEGGV